MLKISIFLWLFLSLSVDNAYAYIDFGTGSYVLQIIAASAVGFIFLVKNYIQKIKQFFTIKKFNDENITKNSEDQR